MDYKKLSWLKASNYRQRVLNIMDDGPKTPKEISEETEYYLSHVSKTLSDLQEKNLVECLTPESKKGKLFRATDEGKKFIKHLEE